MILTKMALDQIREMLYRLKPAWGEIKITKPEAPLPRACPEILGLTMIEGMLLVLAGEDKKLR